MESLVETASLPSKTAMRVLMVRCRLDLQVYGDDDFVRQLSVQLDGR